MQSKVHPTDKRKYRVANWATYNQALVRRGDVTGRCCMKTLLGGADFSGRSAGATLQG